MLNEINNSMDKRGQVELIGAVIVLLVVSYAGYFLIQDRSLSITGYSIKELPKYVGNVNSKKVCLTNEENVNQIPKDLRIFFTSLENANQIGFVYSPDCK